jgi:MoaA/NifB/PqqE/SkfB family radical SAM enzyme
MNRIEQALQRTPRVISLELTTRCNLNCVYCTKKSMQLGDIDMEPKLLQSILDQSDQFDYVVICGIGESFCYPNLYDVLHQLPGKKITIVTNGTIPIDYANLNRQSNIEMLTFSVDAVDPELMKTIGGRFNWDNLLRNLDNLDEYKKKSGAKINRVLNCTINEHNLSELIKLVDFAHQYHFETIHFSLPRGYEEFISGHKSTLVKTLKEVQRKAASFGIYSFDPFEACCVFWKWIAPYVSVQGIFYACCEAFYIDAKIADLQKLSFAEIWKSDEYQAFQNGKLCKDCRFLLNCGMKF